MPFPLPGHRGESRLTDAPPRILVLAPDLEDSALWRRVAMLEAGGAEVRVMGFRRANGPLPHPATVLGRTRNGAMVARVGAVLRAILPLMGRLWRSEAEVILARNLEMLLLARCAALVLRGRPRLVYEVLDIHRLMLGRGAISAGLRGLERILARRVSLILTSSPGFVREYFRPRAHLAAPVLVVENRSFLPDETVDWPAVAIAAPPAPPADPLVIGWFGILRCATSLACLDAMTRAAPGRFRVVMRGRPARDVLPEFEAIVAANPDLAFAGPYRNPEDLGAIYGTVHLVWAIDRFEAGGNSDWLLPNRLYEGCLHRAIPLALEGTETARAVAARGIGIVLEGMDPQRLGARLGAVTQAEIATAQAAITACGVESWRASARDARALVASLARPDTAPAARPVIAPPERPAA